MNQTNHTQKQSVREQLKQQLVNKINQYYNTAEPDQAEKQDLNQMYVTQKCSDFTLLMKVRHENNCALERVEYPLYVYIEAEPTNLYIPIPDCVIDSEQFTGSKELRNLGAMSIEKLSQYTFAQLLEVFEECFPSCDYYEYSWETERGLYVFCEEEIGREIFNSVFLLNNSNLMNGSTWAKYTKGPAALMAKQKMLGNDNPFQIEIVAVTDDGKLETKVRTFNIVEKEN